MNVQELVNLINSFKLELKETRDEMKQMKVDAQKTIDEAKGPGKGWGVGPRYSVREWEKAQAVLEVRRTLGARRTLGRRVDFTTTLQQLM